MCFFRSLPNPGVPAVDPPRRPSSLGFPLPNPWGPRKSGRRGGARRPLSPPDPWGLNPEVTILNTPPISTQPLGSPPWGDLGEIRKPAPRPQRPRGSKSRLPFAICSALYPPFFLLVLQRNAPSLSSSWTCSRPVACHFRRFRDVGTPRSSGARRASGHFLGEAISTKSQVSGPAGATRRRALRS